MSLAGMMLIRAAEMKIAEESRKLSFKTPIHLTIGQEAMAVGVATSLRKTDTIFGNHRSHGHYLASGGDLKSLFSEILGNEDGCSGGRGGSMHITSRSTGFIGALPIVGGTIPIALGAALAHKTCNSENIAIVFFGDGAVEEGVFHEALNLASVMSLPVLFICENNLFSSHLHISERQPATRISRFAEANRIYSSEVDGNDVRRVEDLARKLISDMRHDRKPALIEGLTYRLYGHVGSEIDELVGLNRKRDLAFWKSRDPIERELRRLLHERKIDEKGFCDIRDLVEKFVLDSWESAISGQKPHGLSLLQNVLMDS